jgi:hypothetical protein
MNSMSFRRCAKLGRPRQRGPLREGIAGELTFSGLFASNITLQSKPGDVLLATHKELEERTKSGLARATARAAEAAAKAAEPPPVSNTAHLRDLAQSAARIFGWNTDGPQVQLNQQVVISQEQLEQIRQLLEPLVHEAPQLEGPPQPFPASSGSVGYDVKVTP